MTILNLTQHLATPEQVAAGVVDLLPQQRELLRELLTFDDLPTPGEVEARAEKLASLASDFFAAASSDYAAAQDALGEADAAHSAAWDALGEAVADETSVDADAAASLFAAARQTRRAAVAARRAAAAARRGRTAMIGGGPYLLAPLERALRRTGVDSLYAFSVRESSEERLPDGSVKKVAVFRHLGFVRAE